MLSFKRAPYSRLQADKISRNQNVQLIISIAQSKYIETITLTTETVTFQK